MNKKQLREAHRGPWNALKTDLKTAQDEMSAARREASIWAGRAQTGDWHNIELAMALHQAEQRNRALQEGLKDALAYIGAERLMEVSHGRRPATK
jgi:hypothetical protein